MTVWQENSIMSEYKRLKLSF